MNKAFGQTNQIGPQHMDGYDSWQGTSTLDCFYFHLSRLTSPVSAHGKHIIPQIIAVWLSCTVPVLGLVVPVPMFLTVFLKLSYIGVVTRTRRARTVFFITGYSLLLITLLNGSTPIHQDGTKHSY